MRKQIGMITFVLLGWGLAVSPAMAAEDVKDGRDHPLLKRYEGAVIVKYEHKEFDEYTVPLGKADSNHKLTQSVVVEGEVTKLVYSIPNGRSTLEVIRNYEGDLKAAGYKVLFSGAKEDMGNIAQAAQWQTPTYTIATQRVLTAQLTRPQGTVHVVLFAMSAHYDESDWKVVKGQVLLLAHVIVKKSMENKLSKLRAEEMAGAISDAGSVAVYGIYFDTGKDDVKPESDPTLQEMAKLLKTQPSLKLLVVGHTDNAGTFTSNMELSQRRAQAVVNTLVASHAVAKERLTPVGVSFAAPVASNKTEPGRAKNRRVELVEQ